jgi:protein involved in sex pheromone biosynthesis
MKRLIGAAVVAVSLAMSGASAFAQEANDKVVQESDKVSFKKKTIIDFSDVTIQGELTKPEGSYVLNRKKTAFKSLLKIRANFLPELFNSTDNL